MDCFLAIVLVDGFYLVKFKEACEILWSPFDILYQHLMEVLVVERLFRCRS